MLQFSHIPKRFETELKVNIFKHIPVLLIKELHTKSNSKMISLLPFSKYETITFIQFSDLKTKPPSI